MNEKKNKTIQFSYTTPTKPILVSALEIQKQRNALQTLYLKGNSAANSELETYELNLNKNIKQKLQGYKQQDVKKNRYNSSLFITLDSCLELLVASKLSCYYCKGLCLVEYSTLRQENQWTLDRLDNNIQHQADNLVIACLKCNIGRRRQSSDGYKFTKTMVIQKIE